MRLASFRVALLTLCVAAACHFDGSARDPLADAHTPADAASADAAAAADAAPDDAAPADATPADAAPDDAAPDATPLPDATPDAAPLPDAGPCQRSFDCLDPALPYCDTGTGRCTAGFPNCEGDDRDDGPAAARELTATPVQDGLCSHPEEEVDFYRSVLDGQQTLVFKPVGTNVTWAVTVYDAAGQRVRSAAAQSDQIRVDLAGLTGLHYIEVDNVNSGGFPWPYYIAVVHPECESSFQCGAARPSCFLLECRESPDRCVGDDAREPDDGPSLATDLTSTATGNVCNLPLNELDWYRVAAPQGGVVVLDSPFFPETYTTVVRSDGTVVGSTRTLNEMPITLPASAQPYYAMVGLVGTLRTEVSAYSLEVTPLECETSLDCPAAEPACWNRTCMSLSKCLDDDAAEPDDGPSGARVLSGPFPMILTGMACGWPSAETDWFRIELDGTRRVFSLDFTGRGARHEMDLLDASLGLVARATGNLPRVIDVTGRTGTHYIRLRRYLPTNNRVSTPHTLTVTAP